MNELTRLSFFITKAVATLTMLELLLEKGDQVASVFGFDQEVLALCVNNVDYVLLPSLGSIIPLFDHELILFVLLVAPFHCFQLCLTIVVIIIIF